MVLLIVCMILVITLKMIRLRSFQIDIIKDKDMLDFQFAESVMVVCAKCSEYQKPVTRPIKVKTK